MNWVVVGVLFVSCATLNSAAVWWSRYRKQSHHAWLIVALADLVGGILSDPAFAPPWDGVMESFFGFSLGYSLSKWNSGGGGGQVKRAARWLGDKSRATVARLVQSLQPAPVPSRPAGGQGW